MRVYIAGKVTGLPMGDVFTKFGRAEFWLKEKGHEVVNPLKLCSSAWSWKRCMRVCLAELVKCDAICMLEDWGDSAGAKVEYYVAASLGLTVMAYKASKGLGNR